MGVKTMTDYRAESKKVAEAIKRSDVVLFYNTDCKANVVYRDVGCFLECKFHEAEKKLMTANVMRSAEDRDTALTKNASTLFLYADCIYNEVFPTNRLGERDSASITAMAAENAGNASLEITEEGLFSHDELAPVLFSVPVSKVMGRIDEKLKKHEKVDEDIRKLSQRETQTVLSAAFGKSQVKIYKKALRVLENVRAWCAEQDPDMQVDPRQLVREEVHRQFDKDPNRYTLGKEESKVYDAAINEANARNRAKYER